MRSTVVIGFVFITILNWKLPVSGQIVGHGRPGTNSDYSYGYAGYDSRGPYGGAGGNGRYYVGGTDESGRPYSYGGQAGLPGQPGQPGQPGYPGYPGYGGQSGYAGSPYGGDYRYRYIYGTASSHLINLSLLFTTLMALHVFWKLH